VAITNFGELRKERARKGKAQTVGFSEAIRKSLEPYADAIEGAFVYGSVASGTDRADSDIDLMVIGDDLNYDELYAAAEDVGRKLGRKVHPLFLSPNDWQRKISDEGSMLSKISHAPKILIIGSAETLGHGQAGARQPRQDRKPRDRGRVA
jgi:predicted nucleotidyltransferase